MARRSSENNLKFVIPGIAKAMASQRFAMAGIAILNAPPA